MLIRLFLRATTSRSILQSSSIRRYFSTDKKPSFKFSESDAFYGIEKKSQKPSKSVLTYGAMDKNARFLSAVGSLIVFVLYYVFIKYD